MSRHLLGSTALLARPRGRGPEFVCQLEEGHQRSLS